MEYNKAVESRKKLHNILFYLGVVFLISGCFGFVLSLVAESKMSVPLLSYVASVVLGLLGVGMMSFTPLRKWSSLVAT